MIRKLKTGIVVLSLAINMGLLLILFTPVTEWLYLPLIVNDPLPPSLQLIVVFSGGYYSPDLPNQQALVRLQKAVDLYRAGIAPKIMVLGGPHMEMSVSLVMKNSLAKYHFITEKDLMVHDETGHTYADISSMVAHFAGQIDFNRVVYVSSSYHTWRIKNILIKKGITGPVVAAEPYELYPQNGGERFAFLFGVIREYMAIVYSWLAGWI